MAGFLYVTEYALLPGRGSGWAPMAVQPPVADGNNIAVSGSSQVTNAFNALTQMIRVHNDGIQPVAISIGANPTATVAGATGTARLAANQTEYFLVVPGHKLAAIITS